MRPRLSGDLRRANRVEVIRSFYGGRVRMRAEVAQQLGVSVATVGTIIAELAAAGLLEEAESTKSAGGRPASRLRMRADRWASRWPTPSTCSIRSCWWSAAGSARRSVTRC